MFCDCLQLTSHTLNEYDNDDDDIASVCLIFCWTPVS